MKYSEIKALSTEELVSKISAEKETLRKLKFAHSVSPLENPMQIRQARKVVAKLETELSAKKKA